jgi:hypothetical protein
VVLRQRFQVDEVLGARRTLRRGEVLDRDGRDATGGTSGVAWQSYSCLGIDKRKRLVYGCH